MDDKIWLVCSQKAGRDTVLNAFLDGHKAEQNAEEYRTVVKDREIIVVAGHEIRDLADFNLTRKVRKERKPRVKPLLYKRMYYPNQAGRAPKQRTGLFLAITETILVIHINMRTIARCKTSKPSLDVVDIVLESGRVIEYDGNKYVGDIQLTDKERKVLIDAARET